jgi:hypothetical protein
MGLRVQLMPERLDDRLADLADLDGQVRKGGPADRQPSAREHQFLPI